VQRQQCRAQVPIGAGGKLLLQRRRRCGDHDLHHADKQRRNRLPGASTRPLHARPAASTVVDHPLRDPGGHWRPGGGDSAKRKAPDRCSINEVSAKRSGGQSRRSALSGRPLIASQSDPVVVRCGTPAANWYSTINPPPLTSTPVTAPASLSTAHSTCGRSHWQAGCPLSFLGRLLRVRPIPDNARRWLPVIDRGPVHCAASAMLGETAWSRCARRRSRQGLVRSVID
jgi:hypothetical protein